MWIFQQNYVLVVARISRVKFRGERLWFEASHFVDQEGVVEGPEEEGDRDSQAAATRQRRRGGRKNNRN